MIRRRTGRRTRYCRPGNSFVVCIFCTRSGTLGQQKYIITHLTLHVPKMAIVKESPDLKAPKNSRRLAPLCERHTDLFESLMKEHACHHEYVALCSGERDKIE
jgi:hypothetical protein